VALSVHVPLLPWDTREELSAKVMLFIKSQWFLLILSVAVFVLWLEAMQPQGTVHRETISLILNLCNCTSLS
jgi:hypothetical protein